MDPQYLGKKTERGFAGMGEAEGDILKETGIKKNVATAQRTFK